MRRILVSIKLLLNRFRPVINGYNLFLAIFPNKKTALKLLGGVVADTAVVSGSIKAYEPAWVQINRGATVENCTVKRGSFLLADNGARVSGRIVDFPLLATAGRVYSGCDIAQKRVTVSLDLEGGVALSRISGAERKKRLSQWDSKATALKMLDIFKKYSVPATWAACGHLFLKSCDGNHGYAANDWSAEDPAGDWRDNPAWYMPDFIEKLASDKNMEVGYHSFGHFNYLHESADVVKRDLEFAAVIRSEWKIPLRSLVFPYNAVGFVEEVVAAGFKNLRGYAGQYYMPLTVDFGEFVFYGTSMYVGPRNISGNIKDISNCAGHNYNFFLHPEDWVGEDLSGFEHWCRELAELAQSGRIKLSLMDGGR